MVKKKKNKRKSSRKPARKNKKIKPEKKKKQSAVKPIKASVSEKRDLWNKNVVLAGMVVLLVIFNAWFFIQGKSKNAVKKETQNIDIELGSTGNQEAEKNQPEEKQETEKIDKAVQALLLQRELEQWETYKNTAYGFTLKYPDGWADPVVVKREGEAKYQFKVSFRNKPEGDGQRGFDILVYKSLKKDGNLEPEYTDNLTIKDTAAEDFGNCPEPDVHDVGPNKYPAIEVSALSDDPCFSEAYFLSLQKNSFIYDLVPVPEGGLGYPGYDGEEKVAESLPEFDKMLSTFEFITVTAKKTTTVRKINAPYPKAELKKVNGKLMCAKKNDKPHKSKENNKGKTHMDMECCLDPDETPNPWCTY